MRAWDVRGIEFLLSVGEVKYCRREESMCSVFLPRAEKYSPGIALYLSRSHEAMKTRLPAAYRITHRVPEHGRGS